MSIPKFKYNHETDRIERLSDSGLVIASYRLRDVRHGEQVASIQYRGRTTTINRLKVQAVEQGLLPPEEVIGNTKGRGGYWCKWINTPDRGKIMPYLFKGTELVGMIDYEFNPYKTETK